MGEAKRRAAIREKRFPFSKTLPLARFNVYAIGTRMAAVAGRITEVSWWASQDERLLGVVALDHTDSDFAAMLLARDLRGCFRCVDIQHSIATQFRAEEALRFLIADYVEKGEIEKLGLQGDETNAPLDLLALPTDHDPEKLHPYFRLLLEDPGRSPARAVIREIGPWLSPQDPHLVKEFQTKGFDQRLWEIYLWAALKECMLDVEHLEAPDFLCRGAVQAFTVEATTVAPSTHGALAEHPKPSTEDEMLKFLGDYMPLKFGSALTSKLNKKNQDGLRYWELEKAQGLPFLIAIADFHAPASEKELGSMTYTQSALWTYLYGQRVKWEIKEDQLVIRGEKIAEHTYGEKKAPSGFFDLPDAEHVSAIIFSNAGTISKFDRIGVAAGFGAADHRYLRVGLRYNPDPNAAMGIPFSIDVADPSYSEYWGQELQVFHNPNAKRRLSFEAIMGATHHYFENGDMKSVTPGDAVLSSMTMILKLKKN